MHKDVEGENAFADIVQEVLDVKAAEAEEEYKAAQLLQMEKYALERKRLLNESEKR